MEPFLEKIKRESEKHISQGYLISFLHVSQLFFRSKKFPVIFVEQLSYFKMPVLQPEWNVHQSVPISHFPAITKSKFPDSAASEAFCPQTPHRNLYLSFHLIKFQWGQIPAQIPPELFGCLVSYSHWFGGGGGGDACWGGQWGKEAFCKPVSSVYKWFP